MTKNYKEIAETFKTEWVKTNNEVGKITQEFSWLHTEKRRLLKRLEDILTTLELLREKDPTISLDNLDIPLELKVKIPAGSSIADAMEAILKQFGSMKTAEMIQKLREFKISISEKNARIVVRNAIKRDSKQRFILDEEKRIALARGNEKRSH